MSHITSKLFADCQILNEDRVRLIVGYAKNDVQHDREENGNQ